MQRKKIDATRKSTSWKHEVTPNSASLWIWGLTLASQKYISERKSVTFEECVDGVVTLQMLL